MSVETQGMQRKGSRGSMSRMGRLVVVGILFLSLSAWAAPKVDPLIAEYTALLKAAAPGEVAKRLLADARDERAGEKIEAFGEVLAVQAGKAGAVLDALAQGSSVQATTLRAELLVWMARGDETPNWKRKNRDSEPVEMTTDEVGRRAGALLDHADPVVRGLAEWAIAIRMGVEYEGAQERTDGRRFARPWPGENGPAWYRAWAAIDDEALLELDYVRQLVAVDGHRSTTRLLDAARDVRKRVEALGAYIEEHGTSSQVETLHRRMACVRHAYHQLQQGVKRSPDDLTLQRKYWLALRRAARAVVLETPDLDFDRVLFATWQASQGSGNITAGRWNTHTPGGDILIKTGFSPTDPVRPLIDGRLGPGHVRGLDLWWDADRLVFAFVRQPGRVEGVPEPEYTFGGYFGLGDELELTSNLYEMGIDGSRLRRLTDSRLHVDQEPCYLPNGDIVFVSDRSFFGSQCAGALEQDNMILNLWRCDSNGDNIRPLSNNKDFDRHPHMMDNGQLLFLHWEYQERHLWQTHTLWTCRPDGTMTDAVYKQHIETGPMSLREARQVYGQEKLVAIGCGHHNWDQGAVMLADYAMGINERGAMQMITPGVSGTEGGYGGIKPPSEGGVQDDGGHYMYPYPLSGKSFLVSYSYKRPEHTAGRNFSLYYIDVWGNKELIHRDRRLSVAYLMPLRETLRPPITPELPPAPETGQRYAVATVMDVHAGWPQELQDRVKYLRISQKTPWPCVTDETKACGFNDLHWMPSAWEPVLGMWDWGAARVIGTVPVEEDGSAHFKVPADQTVYFHALDENFIELRRMRSNVTFMAGETRSCIGCHESKTVVPTMSQSAVPLALRREPSIPVPPPWGDRRLPDYERDIQPIFSAHCASCHGQADPAGGLEFTARRIDGYMQSYRTLFGLEPNEPTPFARGYYATWFPDRPALDRETHDAAKDWLRNVPREPAEDQLVRLADYMGGAEVTDYLEFGSGASKLTLTLLEDDYHRRQVDVSSDEWQALVTWLDLNAQYWGTYVEKDRHYASRRSDGEVVPPRRVEAIFPDPWRRPPAGEWMWRDEQTVVMKPPPTGTGVERR